MLFTSIFSRKGLELLCERQDCMNGKETGRKRL